MCKYVISHVINKLLEALFFSSVDGSSCVAPFSAGKSATDWKSGWTWHVGITWFLNDALGRDGAPAAFIAPRSVWVHALHKHSVCASPPPSTTFLFPGNRRHAEVECRDVSEHRSSNASCEEDVTFSRIPFRTRDYRSDRINHRGGWETICQNHWQRYNWS